MLRLTLLEGRSTIPLPPSFLTVYGVYYRHYRPPPSYLDDVIP